jgi:spore coat protein CotH
MLFLAACAPKSDDDSGKNGGTDTVDEEPALPITEQSIEDQPEGDPWIFSKEVIHQIEITLPEASVDAINAAPYEQAVGDVVIDGVALDDIGVRLRGKIGSFRTLAGKPKFKLDFNTFVDGRRYYGLESLSLNNSVVDCSYMKEVLSYTVFEAIGSPASRTSFAEVTVNGAAYGLYVIVETQDDRYLNDKFADGSGNLYDGKYRYYGDRNYLLLDFGEGNDDEFELEEGEDVGNADIAAISTTLLATAGTDDFYAAMGEVMDWEQVHMVWAGEQWVGQNDGYCMNKNNYRVYFNPEDGLANWIPWDMDYSFLRDYEWSRSWSNPSGNLARYCFADATCRARHREVVGEMLEIVDDLDLSDLNVELVSLTRDAARADPRRECATTSVDSERTEVSAWLRSRSDELRASWAL